MQCETIKKLVEFNYYILQYFRFNIFIKYVQILQ